MLLFSIWGSLTSKMKTFFWLQKDPNGTSSLSTGSSLLQEIEVQNEEVAAFCQSITK